MKLSQEAVNAVSKAGELLIRSAAAIGLLSKADQAALDEATGGNLLQSIVKAIEGAAAVSPQVAQSLKAHPPEGFDALSSNSDIEVDIADRPRA